MKCAPCLNACSRRIDGVLKIKILFPIFDICFLPGASLISWFQLLGLLWNASIYYGHFDLQSVSFPQGAKFCSVPRCNECGCSSKELMNVTNKRRTCHSCIVWSENWFVLWHDTSLTDSFFLWSVSLVWSGFAPRLWVLLDRLVCHGNWVSWMHCWIV